MGGNFKPLSQNIIRKIDIPPSLIFELKKWKLACPINKYDLVFPNTDVEFTVHNTA